MFGWFKRKKKRSQARKRGDRTHGHDTGGSFFDWFHGMLVGSALAPDEADASAHHHGHGDAAPSAHDQSVPESGPSFDAGAPDAGGFDGGTSGGGSGADW